MIAEIGDWKRLRRTALLPAEQRLAVVYLNDALEMAMHCNRGLPQTQTVSAVKQRNAIGEKGVNGFTPKVVLQSAPSAR